MYRKIVTTIKNDDQECSQESSQECNQENVNTTQQDSLKLVKENNTITQQEMADKLGLSMAAIKKNITILKKMEIILRQGQPKKVNGC